MSFRTVIRAIYAFEEKPQSIFTKTFEELLPLSRGVKVSPFEVENDPGLMADIHEAKLSSTLKATSMTFEAFCSTRNIANEKRQSLIKLAQTNGWSHEERKNE